MAEFKKNSLIVEHKFDTKTKRHYLNNTQTVFHCHHYTTLYTQLALDAGETVLLQNVAEESFFDLISNYFETHNIENLDEKVDIACEYYAALGLGDVKVRFLGEYSGEVISEHSHIEQGWLKKWGKYDKTVNYIGCGYVAAMFSAILDKPIGTFFVKEHQSIVKGDKFTMFKIVKK